MTTIGTRLHTWLNGLQVGVDRSGHRYFHDKRVPKSGRRKRWVIYLGEVEASAVPPEWHAWLHYTINDVPTDGGSLKHSWQKLHIPNQTGTPCAYRPQGHTLRCGTRPPATGDYEAWSPDSTE